MKTGYMVKYQNETIRDMINEYENSTPSLNLMSAIECACENGVPGQSYKIYNTNLELMATGIVLKLNDNSN